LPAVVALRRRPLTADNIAVIADALDDRYITMVWSGAGLGLRRGEVAGLTRPGSGTPIPG
jgi:hypothetical protein